MAGEVTERVEPPQPNSRLATAVSISKPAWGRQWR